MAQIRHNNPLLHRMVRPGQWLTSGMRREDQVAPTALSIPALLAALVAEGWLAQLLAGTVHVTEGGGAGGGDITVADLEACNIAALPDALEHDVREELVRQGICP